MTIWTIYFILTVLILDYHYRWTVTVRLLMVSLMYCIIHLYRFVLCISLVLKNKQEEEEGEEEDEGDILKISSIVVYVQNCKILMLMAGSQQQGDTARHSTRTIDRRSLLL